VRRPLPVFVPGQRPSQPLSSATSPARAATPTPSSKATASRSRTPAARSLGRVAVARLRASSAAGRRHLRHRGGCQHRRRPSLHQWSAHRQRRAGVPRLLHRFGPHSAIVADDSVNSCKVFVVDESGLVDVKCIEFGRAGMLRNSLAHFTSPVDRAAPGRPGRKPIRPTRQRCAIPDPAA
jgi:hypothetical protein